MVFSPRFAYLWSRSLLTPRVTWQLLQISDSLDAEFASALSESVPVLGWKPERHLLPWGLPELEETLTDPPLRIRHFPLQRGYSRFPFSLFFDLGSSLAKRIARQCEDPTRSPLICTVPYFASVAAHWPGPVVYWLTDLIAAYPSADAAQVCRLDQYLCGIADLVCPNSFRLAEYLIDRAGCDPTKIEVIANATREKNLLPAPPMHPADLPADLAGLPRPVAGVIGNLAGNLDWIFLERLIRLSAGFSWAFVGPTTMEVADPAQRAARAMVMAHPAARFVGKKPYGELATYARALDVAILPYLRGEPTYSGSSTRFYEHLAAAQPILATRGFEELLRKEPLLQLVDSAENAAEALRRLKALHFKDGLRSLRWKAGQSATWQQRARAMQQALAERLPYRDKTRGSHPSGPAAAHRFAMLSLT